MMRSLRQVSLNRVLKRHVFLRILLSETNFFRLEKRAGVKEGWDQVRPSDTSPAVPLKLAADRDSQG